MVFSSLPPYQLDSSNWHHQHISGHDHIIGSSNSSPQAPPEQPHVRAGSMSERARQANIPMPEPAQRCPRCDSTNTKFCYFNNYSLSQPRHFCKTCRRYWTRGGALRTVPVGGGCRRPNKRSSSKPTSTSSSSKSACSSAPNNPASNTAHLPYDGPQFQPMRFVSPLMSQLSEGFTGEMMMMNLNSTYINNNNNNNNNNIPSDYHASSNSFLGFEQWKLQQFPFLGGLDLGVYNEFQGDGQKMMSSLSQVKMEENMKNPAGLSLMSRDQWSDVGGGTASAANNWTHQLSTFASPSTSNHLQ